MKTRESVMRASPHTLSSPHLACIAPASLHAQCFVRRMLSTTLALLFYLLRCSQAMQRGHQPTSHELPSSRHGPRILTYITTHMSSMHHEYLERCWPTLLENLPIFRRSDFMMFVTTGHRRKKVDLDLIRSVFAGPGIIVHVRSNPGYQEGAVLALTEAYKNGWFEGYDWVVRVNPDVVIRNDTFLLASMKDDSISGIFDDCLEKACPGGRQSLQRLIQTDFIAFRPDAVSRDKLLGSNITNAEKMATQVFSSIVKNGSDAWLPNTGPHKGNCRVTGDLSPVVHDHRANISSCMWSL